MIWNIIVIILSLFTCNLCYRLFLHFQRPRTIQKVKTLLDLSPRIIKFYRHSVKMICNKCGNAQTTKINSRCHRRGKCSRCLQKEWLRGHLAYWG
jgi:hypothetical protein